MQIIGVDTGGTFTDTVVTSERGTSRIGKALSTPAAVEIGVLDSLRAAADGLGTDARRAARGHRACSRTAPPSASTRCSPAPGREGRPAHHRRASSRRSRSPRRNKILGLDEHLRTDRCGGTSPEPAVARARASSACASASTRHGDVVTPLDDDDVASAIARLRPRRRRGRRASACCGRSSEPRARARGSPSSSRELAARRPRHRVARARAPHRRVRAHVDRRARRRTSVR